jgi:L-ascorbate metabolism protein UlaG (beta-lactamase superfamily)
MTSPGISPAPGPATVRTLTSDQAARAARILDARVVIPAHTEGWKHFTQGPDTIAPAFARHGATGQLRLLAPGESTVL